MSLLIVLVLVLQGPREEETYTLTVAVETMHCDECKASLEANLRALRGVKTVDVHAAYASATVLEEHAVRYRQLASSLPSDLKLKSVTLEFRGVISAKGDGLQVKAKESDRMWPLANKDEKKDDIVTKLKKELASPPKYKVTAELVEKERVETLLLSAMPAKDNWKDEKK